MLRGMFEMFMLSWHAFPLLMAQLSAGTRLPAFPPLPTAVVTAFVVAAFAAAGAVAGWLARCVLRRLPRGAVVPPGWCEVGVAALWSAVAVRAVDGLPLWWSVVPLVLGWLAVPLAACDALAGRLPDALTLPVYPAAALVLVLASCWGDAPGLLVRAPLGTALFAGAYSLVRLLRPVAMGCGDVKLAGGLGAVVGAVSLSAVLWSIFAAVLTLVVAAAARARVVAHGPAMLAPAWFVTASASGPALHTGFG